MHFLKELPAWQTLYTEGLERISAQSRRVTSTYVGVFDWLVSYAVCD